MNNFILFVAIFLAPTSISFVTGKVSITKTNKNKVYQSGDLIFQDEFDSFDLETWDHELTFSGNSNWEFQMYINTRKVSFVKDGHLHIKPILSVDHYDWVLVYNWAHDIIPLSIEGSSPVDR
ncbi:unnamed protein product [Allacma fusca]|uniref:Uncharacterized protein n=1 Tax=Allacma fusca TaxID=39272 RepID=A0A8J2KB82_9HEXA|nr:unnamed protein product [Allacma fusca]